ncbi:MAG: hypothetical protein FRX49_08047 [Trebouxia sp. A1-2]|nr:MAG: hypothetical protein FRX49_08047 [Trebouxia sp. A1-2]
MRRLSKVEEKSPGIYQSRAEFVAFGAQTPTDFQHQVKQKPDGTLYVEWDVCCRRCGAYATLDRAKESQRDKDRLLLTGKGNARTMECWLRAEGSEGKAPFCCKSGGPDKGQPSSQHAEVTMGSQPLHSISTGPPKWQAVTGSQLQAPSLDPPAVPRGLNGPLLSHPRKRKTPDASVTASQLQHRVPNKDSSSSAVKSETIDRMKRVKTETCADRVMSGSFDCIDLTQMEVQPQQHVSASSSPDSLEIMFKMVNCTLGNKAISQEQMQLLQGAVDSVDELKGLKRKQLSFVLESIGKMETCQMIVIRHYLTGLQSAATS